MNRNRINTTFDLVLLMLYTVSSIFLCVQISLITNIENIVKFFLIGVLIVLLLSFIFYIFVSKEFYFFKKVFLIVLTLFYVFLSLDVYLTNKHNNTSTLNTYYRINLVSDTKQIEDLNESVIGTLINDRNYLSSFEDKNEAFKLKDALFKEYHTMDKLIKDFSSGKIQGFVLSDQNIYYLNERYPDINLNVLSKNAHSVNVSHILNNVDHNQAYSILLSITDIDDLNYASSTKQCYLIFVDPIIHKISFVNIPSNLYIPNIAYDSYPDTLHNVSFNGIDNLLYSIEKMIDVKIDYFVKINPKYIKNNFDVVETVKLMNQEVIDNMIISTETLINKENIDEYLIENNYDISELFIEMFNSKENITGNKLNNFINNFESNTFTNLSIEPLNELFIKFRFFDWTIEKIELEKLSEYYEPCISYGVSDKFKVSIMNTQYIKDLYQCFIDMKHIELMENFEFDLNYIKSLSMPTKLNDKIITQENRYWKVDNYFSVLPDSMIHPVEVEKWQESISFENPKFDPDGEIKPIE